jgi:hypothetical protein
MGFWKKIRDSWRESKERDDEAEKQAIVERHMKDLERAQQEQGRSPRLPPRGDRG